MAPTKSFQNNTNHEMKMMKKALENPEEEPLVTVLAKEGTIKGEGFQPNKQTQSGEKVAPETVEKQGKNVWRPHHDRGMTRLSIDSNDESEMSVVDIDNLDMRASRCFSCTNLECLQFLLRVIGVLGGIMIFFLIVLEIFKSIKQANGTE